MLEDLEIRVTGLAAGVAGATASADPEFARLTEVLFGRTTIARHLSPETHAAVSLALDALVTQLDPIRLRAGIERATRVLTDRQVQTVLQLVSVAGLHSVSTGAPALAEEVRLRFGETGLSERQRDIRNDFENNGPRPRPMDEMYASILERDPDYFDAFRAWIDHPWRAGTLDHGTMHLICIAIDIACTHLYESGFRRHVREAFELGVTPEAIFEVVEMCSAEGLRTIFVDGSAWGLAQQRAQQV